MKKSFSLFFALLIANITMTNGKSFTCLPDFAGTPENGYVFVANANSCTLTTTASVTANVSCHGGNNGNAIATPSSGTAPYTYSWSNGTTNIVSTSNPTGAILSAGSYTVTVQDAIHCSATASVTITQPVSLLLSSSVPITLTNSQASSTASNFQQMITINSSTYSSYENTGLQNVEFTTGP
ncbi:MAG TPA: SprB repeat-containing protein, partial [Bacteroidia bacterium]|nr:SprB repeat-containing protein [Bacteroidia bacterium]